MTALPPSPLGIRFNPFSASVQEILDRAVYATMRFESIEGALAAAIRRIADEEVFELPFIDALTISASPLTSPPVRWDYQWAEARLTAANTWEFMPGGRTSAVLGAARNRAEYLNTIAVAAHGVTLNDPPVIFTVLAIPNGTPIKLWPSIQPTGTLKYWFSEVNALDPECQ